MASTQLYRKGQLHISEANHDWHFLRYALDLLAQTAAEGSCDMNFGHNFVQACFGDTGHKANMFGRIKDDRAEFIMRSTDGVMPAYSEKTLSMFTIFTAESALKRCTCAPPLTSANVALESTNSLSQEELKALAQSFFSLVQQHDGFLVFLFAGDAANLLVCHTQDGWSMDYRPCMVAYPILDMNNIPAEVVSLRVRLYSRGSRDIQSFMPVLHEDSMHASEGGEFDLECEAKVKFAYNHNIAIDAWLDEQHEQPDGFFPNLDDYHDDTMMMGEDGYFSDASFFDAFF